MVPIELIQTQLHETNIENVDVIDALISRVFTKITSLKSAYILLQAAHTPYDPNMIQVADKQVIAELKTLSELKHFYRENNPKSLCVPLQDSRLAAEIEEQQSLLRTYEVMVKKFQSEIQSKDSEMRQLQQQIEEAIFKREKLEKNLKLRGLSERDSEVSAGQKHFSPMDLNPDLIISAVEAAYIAIHDFSKPVINMMKSAKWNLDAAAKSITPSVVYTKRAHKKYAFESYICHRMFMGFQHESFSKKPDDVSMDKPSFFHQYLSLREMDPTDALSQNPDSIFGKFCRSKYKEVIHPKMELSFFGNVDQRNYVMEGGQPRTAFYQAFLKLAKSIWILHRVAHSFDPTIKIFEVNKGNKFSEVYMESVLKSSETKQKPRVGLMVMPGFCIGDVIVRSRVYLSGMKVAH